MRCSYSEIADGNKVTVWNSSILVALVAVGTVAATYGTLSVSQSLWTTPKVLQVPVTASTLLQGTPEVKLPIQAAAAQPFTAEVVPAAQTADAKPRLFEYASNALLMVLGFCAGAWASARLTQRSVPESLDLERGVNMGSTAAATETEYFFVIANAKFMLFDEEHAMEVLREKRRFLREKGIPQDFWIVPNPEFLDKFPELDKRVLKPCAAIVSTDEQWITFMKLRLDRVLSGSFKGSTDVKKELASKGGDPLAGIPKWEVPADWSQKVPYPHYSNDWYHVFLVGAEQ